MNCFFKFLLKCCCIEEEEEEEEVGIEAFINWGNYDASQSREHIEVYYPEY